MKENHIFFEKLLKNFFIRARPNLLCWFPGSEKSEANGNGGFLCYFLRSGRVKSRWWLNSSVGVAFSDGHSAPLLVSPSICFLSSYSLPLPLSSFPFVSLPSPPLLSAVHPLAFIAKGCWCFPFVVAGME